MKNLIFLSSVLLVILSCRKDMELHDKHSKEGTVEVIDGSGTINSGGGNNVVETSWFCVSGECLELEDGSGPFASQSDCEANCSTNNTGSITSLSCNSATHTGTLVQGQSASGVSSSVPYSGGNGEVHSGQTVNSTGVTGLTATLSAGTFANGNGSLVYTITGTPSSSGTTSFSLNIGGQSCVMSRVVNTASGSITSLSCNSATHTGTLVQGQSASGVSSSVPYSGGNGGTHNGQTVNSTGVTGLTATLSAGTFANGNGSLVYTITGTPSSSGTASFSLNIGGQSCVMSTIVDAQPSYPPGTVHCNGMPTSVIDVTNPSTGKTWMDRNLGASQVATNSFDANAYGDLYQWGRGADGHQCRTSSTTTTKSSTDQPGHGDFILGASPSPFDWRSPQNTNLWQGVNGVNNPCPSGYRLPTEPELNTERTSWSSNNALGAFTSPLKLPIAGYRNNTGSLNGSGGNYWSSMVSSTNSRYLNFDSSGALMSTSIRSIGYSVRCIKD
jgi:uncharacterized protein (TIGR02145 family)